VIVHAKNCKYKLADFLLQAIAGKNTLPADAESVDRSSSQAQEDYQIGHSVLIFQRINFNSTDKNQRMASKESHSGSLEDIDRIIVISKETIDHGREDEVAPGEN
jgi:hypothetical protein